jgi:hypothetical protein
MCKGEFRVHVDIITEYGHRTYNDFIISVGNDWHSLDATKQDCHCIQESFLGRTWNRIRRRN